MIPVHPSEKSAEFLAAGYDRYLRMAQGPTRFILHDVLVEVEEIATSVAPDAEPGTQDYTSLLLGANALSATIDAMYLDTYDDPADDKEHFIVRFGSAMNAFYPDGISYAERMDLFDLAEQARQRAECRDTTNNAEIYAARHNLLHRLIGKDKDGSKHYQRYDIDNLFELAIWLRGEGETDPRGWSLSPQLVLTQNVPLVRFSVERLDARSRGLADLVGTTQQKILSMAARAITRFDSQEKIVRDQAAEMESMGERGILRHARIRPDIMSLPIQVIQDQEEEYVDMGFSLDDVRADYKMYVYNPERIRARLDCFDALTRASVGHLANTQADLVVTQTRQEIVGKTQLVVNNSERKIIKYTELVQRYSTTESWIEALRTAHAQAKHAPRQAALNNLLRANYDDLKAAMEANPHQNIFLAARELVNEKARKRYKEKMDAARKI